MPKANELKRGAVVRAKDQVCVVRHIDIRSPSSRGSNTLYKVADLQGRGCR
jgi:elongation factor P